MIDVRTPQEFELGHIEDSINIDWLNIVSAITLTCCPALSLPAGFTKSHLPVGLQVVAPNRDEGKLLSGSLFIEELISIKEKLPIDPISKY